MAKVKNHFVCQQCGHDSSQWLGKCPGCAAWNSMVEETVVCKPETKTWHSTSEGTKPRPITEVDNLPVPRLATGVGEFDRVLGGGIVPGSLILIGGDPGIGYLYYFRVFNINILESFRNLLLRLRLCVRIGYSPEWIVNYNG